MATTRFDHAGGSVVFGRGPRRPGVGLDLLQGEAISGGGVRFGYDPNALERPLTLEWVGLSAVDRANLETFFTDVAVGMVEPFTFTDPQGVKHAVRFAAAALDFTETAFERYAVTVPLLELT